MVNWPIRIGLDQMEALRFAQFTKDFVIKLNFVRPLKFRTAKATTRVNSMFQLFNLTVRRYS